RILAARECLVDVPVSQVAVDHEGDADDCERDADQLERPLRAPGEPRAEAAGAAADRERGQARPPPGEVGALVGEPRPARRVARLVEYGHAARFAPCGPFPPAFAGSPSGVESRP